MLHQHGKITNNGYRSVLVDPLSLLVVRQHTETSYVPFIALANQRATLYRFTNQSATLYRYDISNGGGVQASLMARQNNLFNAF